MPGRTRCRYCNRVLTALEHYSSDCCSSWKCKEQQLRERLVVFREDASKQLGVTDAERFVPVVIPHRAGQVGPIEPERLQALEDRLIELSATYAGRGKPDERPPEPPDPVPSVCASCRGACCYHGGQHTAFIDDETIERFASQHPALSAAEITAAYLEHVPDTHFLTSCVFHTEHGCNLPRTKRAAICNLYECRGLRTARDAGPHAAIFIVARHDNAIVRGEFVDESGAHLTATP